jgi:hypothetical protein
MELDGLRDPQRVALRAKEMGMVPPSSPAFIRLSDGQVLGNPTAATYETSLRVTPLPTRKPKNLRPTPVVIEVSPQESAAPDGAPTPPSTTSAGTKKASDRDRQQGGQR